MIKVALADREHLLGQALARLLGAETDIQITGTHTDADALVRHVEGGGVDVVLMDPLGMTPLGMELVRRVLAADPSTKVVILTTTQQEQQLFSAIRAGARGYLLKSADLSEVLSALRSVAFGEAQITPELAVQLLDEFARLSFQETGLTARERDILSAIVQGDSNREIANQLGLSEKTVKNYVSDILSKLNVRDRTEAAVYALQMGLVSDGDWRMTVTTRRNAS